MISTYLIQNNVQGSVQDCKVTLGGLEQLLAWQQKPEGMMWLDIQSETLSDSRVSKILDDMNCHGLAISDALRKRHPPKVELFEDHFFILYRGMSEIRSHIEFTHQQIAFFVGENYLITIHPQQSLGIEKELAKGWDALKQQTPMSLALSIIHFSAGIYLEQVLSFEDELGEIEEALYGDRSEAALMDLASYKASLIKLKRVFSYHDAMFQQWQSLSPKDLPFDCADYEHRINDVAERLERLHSLSQMYYDICGDMIDSYISITSHQMNITMRVLTVVTVIFVPLTFVAGIYGMNFENMPELRFKYAYFIALSAMFSMGIVMVLMFKRRKWF